MTPDEAHLWRREYKEVSELVGKERAERVAEVCNKLEHSIRLIGCSAVEDKLQDKVPDTLAYLLEVCLSVHVWLCRLSDHDHSRLV